MLIVLGYVLGALPFAVLVWHLHGQLQLVRRDNQKLIDELSLRSSGRKVFSPSPPEPPAEVNPGEFNIFTPSMMEEEMLTDGDYEHLRRNGVL